MSVFGHLEEGEATACAFAPLYLLDQAHVKEDLCDLELYLTLLAEFVFPHMDLRFPLVKKYRIRFASQVYLLSSVFESHSQEPSRYPEKKAEGSNESAGKPHR